MPSDERFLNCWTLIIIAGVTSSLVDQGWHHWTTVKIKVALLSPLEGRWRSERSLAIRITTKLCLVLTIQVHSTSESFLRTEFRRKKGEKRNFVNWVSVVLKVCRICWSFVHATGDSSKWPKTHRCRALEHWRLARRILKKREEERIWGEMMGYGFHF